MARIVSDKGDRSLRRLKQLYDEAAQLARIGAWQCDLDDEALTWTDGVYDLFELPRGSRLYRPAIVDMYSSQSRRELETVRDDAIRCGQGFSLDACVQTERHATRWVRVTAAVERVGGRPVRLFGTKQDITHEKALWDRLRQLAEYDALTGLANRAIFEARYGEFMKSDGGSQCALALVDLDGFKQINDRFGHAAGDECLRQTAARLRQAFESAALIARIGGDEFAVLLTGPFGAGLPNIDLERALRMLCRPVFWRSIRIDVGASIGLAPARNRPPSRAEGLFAEADAALYAAKAGGRNMARVFGESEALAYAPLVIRQPPAA